MTPEILSLKSPELPHFVEDGLRRPLALAGSVLAVAGIGLAGNVDEAKAAPEICTAPTGAQPIPKSPINNTGVELSVDLPALNRNACTQTSLTVSSNIRNYGNQEAKAIFFSVMVSPSLQKNVKAIRAGGTSYKISTSNKDPLTPTCSPTPAFGIDNRWTTQWDCSLNQYLSVPANATIPVEVDLLPTSTDKNAYINLYTVDRPTTENETKRANNHATKKFAIADVNGTSSPPQPNPKACTPPAFNILYSKKNKTVTFAMKARGNKISGICNGVAKSVNERSRATRMLVDVKAGTKLAPNQPAVIQDGRKVIVDLPNAGVTKTKYTTRTIRTKTFNGLGKFGKAFVPKGKLPGCNKDLIVYAQLINKDLKK